MRTQFVEIKDLSLSFLNLRYRFSRYVLVIMVKFNVST